MLLYPVLSMTLLVLSWPQAAEIDFAPLPAAGVRGYKLQVIFTTGAGEVVKVPQQFAKSVTPEEAAGIFAFSLKQAEWKSVRNGTKLTAYGSEKSPVVKVEFVSDVAPPVVHWKPLPPKEK